MTNADKFLNIYNRLDAYMRKELQEEDYVSHTKLLNNMKARGNIYFKYNIDDLKSYATLRNAIVHNPKSKEAKPIAEPHDLIVKKYEDLVNRVLNPPKALDSIAIRRQDVFTTTLDDNALLVMKEMNKNIFTHVPVIEEDKMIGVFSENTVFTFFADKDIALFEDKMKIKDFINYIPIEKHQSETFKFVSRDTTVLEIEEIFRKEFENKKRISAIFITENGKEEEKLLGLITPWDVVG